MGTQGRPRKQFNQDLAKALLLEGKTIRSISEALGIHHNTIWHYSKEWRAAGMVIPARVKIVPPKNPRGTPARLIDTSQVSKMLETQPVVEVANSLGVSRNLIYYRINNAKNPAIRILSPASGFIRSLQSPSSRSPAIGLTEFYPFIRSTPDADYDLVLAVNALVPRWLPDQTRADVCQDMIVAILTGDVTLDNLRGATPKYVKMFMKGSPSKYGHLSLDAPAGYGDERTLGERLGL